jgi:hypothetical protein
VFDRERHISGHREEASRKIERKIKIIERENTI